MTAMTDTEYPTVQTIRPCSKHLTGPIPERCPHCSYGPVVSVPEQRRLAEAAR